MGNRKILRNIAECKLCGDIIESVHVHDFVRCKCGEITTDGGTYYFHRSWGTDRSNIIGRSTFADDDSEPAVNVGVDAPWPY